MAGIEQAGSAAAGLQAREEDGALVLRLSGDLDLTNAEQVRSAIDAVVSSETQRLIFDLEGSLIPPSPEGKRPAAGDV
jgi:hypothetical protein